MISGRDEILSWYRDAAQKLVDLLTKTRDKSQDIDAAAVTDLVARQAGCLVALHHEVLASKPSAQPRINREILTQRLDDCASICYSKFYAYRFDRLPSYWRQLYTDTLILTTFHDILSHDGGFSSPQKLLDTVVSRLDRALITAGGASLLGSAWIEKTLQLLERLSIPDAQQQRASKRARREFSSDEPYGRPDLTNTERLVPRCQDWSLATFETYMNDADRAPRPLIFTDLAYGWPALTSNPWKSPDYLLSRTFGGRRLVPVEIGRSYVDVGWGQDLVPFSQFLAQYVEQQSALAEVGYLAQHSLFQQIPALRHDICVPDFCWASVPESGRRERLEVPQLNAWFGPARTITPLHTDAYHNLLVQVVGTKYVRLYPPWRNMQPRGREDGVDMSNTSAVDLGAVEGWDDSPRMSDDEREKIKRDLSEGEYWECVLGEGDTLLIPMGWWHYVRSLSVSFSVSFWWN